jgi:hypothetical protein
MIKCLTGTRTSNYDSSLFADSQLHHGNVTALNTVHFAALSNLPVRIVTVPPNRFTFRRELRTVCLIPTKTLLRLVRPPRKHFWDCRTFVLIVSISVTSSGSSCSIDEQNRAFPTSQPQLLSAMLILHAARLKRVDSRIDHLLCNVHLFHGDVHIEALSKL